MNSACAEAVDLLPDVEPTWDVIVIGGGPAGATTAALIADHGHRVLLLERASLPRFHVGESLIPETWWTLRRLGMLERLEQSDFPRKYSVQFVSDGHRESAPFYFDEYNDHQSSVTWQVLRGEFDQMLLERAGELGAVVHTSAQVTEVIFDGDQATGVQARLQTQTGERVDRKFQAQVVVDATGQSAFLGTRAGRRLRDPQLRKATIWGHQRGARRDSGRDEGATLIMQTPDKKSWFWYIPLPNDVVSVGCTGDMDYMFPSGTTAADTFARELERCPAMQERLQSAELIGDYRVTQDFSYAMEQGSGPGWLLVGDALGFIDPVYSSGVFLALKGGEFAADAVHDALERRDTSAARLGQWLPHYRQGLDNFRQLVYAFYAPGFSFASFLKEYPQYRSNLVDILVGDVFKPGVGDMFAAMPELSPTMSNSSTAS